MVKYLVHSTSVATEKNKAFFGETEESYHGKGNVLCGLYVYSGDEIKRVKKFIPEYDARHYGYDSVSMAKRNWSYKNPENNPFWETTVEIIAIELKGE
jgi:hypothetical protein